MRVLVLATGLLTIFSSCVAQTVPNASIYDDNPMQKMTIGTEESEYYIRKPTGLTDVDPRVEPPNWYVDLAEPTFEVLVYDRNVGRMDRAEVNHPGLRVDYVRGVANPNYLFVGLRMAKGTPAGRFDIQLSGDGTGKTVPYELRERPERPTAPTLTEKDLIYLIMPDRFANGDPSNDSVDGMQQTGTNRAKFLFRHGGDLAGIRDRLDYLADLGVTALWLNPVLENDQPYESYHGYAITDHYRIDRRFGTNEEYRELVEAAHERGIKIVMDVIFNHVGDKHWLVEDLPGTDWIHQWPEYTQTTYRATTLMDPHVSDYDRKRMTDGWFDKHMPDLNQQNEHLARYLIQNSIWWTLWSGQDAFRIDTYAYSDPEFTSEWNRRMLEEFPELGIYGETWVHGPAVQAFFTGGRGIHDEFDTHLPGVTDFQVYYGIQEALGKNPGWTDGILKLYYSLAQDYLYADPRKNVIFLDNHDLSRLYSSVGEDVGKLKSALALLLTMRGIPMLYYGTEVALGGSGGTFGEGGRIDFPGGFPGDTIDLFSAANRNALQREVFDYTHRLANFRKSSAAITGGTFTQFVPRDGVYTYFRNHGKETVMVIFNGNDTAREGVDLSPYAEQIGGYTVARDVTRDVDVSQLTRLDLGPKEVRILALK